MIHAVLIASVGDKEAAEALGQAMGWGTENYTVPLPMDDPEPTDYGLSAYVSESFVTLYNMCLEGTPPPGIPLEMIEVVPNLFVDFDTEGKYSSALDHFNTVINYIGLGQSNV